MDLGDDLRELLARQHGLATRRQLYDAGITQEAMRWRLGRSWRAVLRRVVSTSPDPLTNDQRLVAAALEAGPAGLVTAEHACLAHGLRSAVGSRPIRVLVPPSMQTRRVGFVDIRRTRRLGQAVSVGHVLRLSTVPRAVMDAARNAKRPDEARSLVIEAVQARRATLDDLQHELEAGPVNGSAMARTALDEARGGSWSVPEADVLHLCETSRLLPPALPNPLLFVDGRRLLSPDLWFDDVAMAVMVHSRAHHERSMDWEGTVEGDGELAAAGIVVIGFTPRSIGTRPGQVLTRIEETYRFALKRPRPNVRVELRD
ncbi:hypothetical protein ACPPVT_13475 [Angustibacter sp. McL0619]|uniref:hypothetical protein n=1 Tax=Angustibacter sp. McL0619 TaxID=3415676 RepID=UPI003CEB4152